ncbi:MAG: SDR family oxidoreductase [Ignavibacteria bacterium]|nr:SDR family oxidoreductase [Ignavibacteria bacterium]
MTEQQRIALVTGASQGIGRAITMELASNGLTVAIHYHRNNTEAERTRAHAGGAPHRLYQADLSNPRDAEKLVTAVVNDFGRLDVLVHNAAVIEDHKIRSCNFDEWVNVWDRTLATNLLGPAHLTFCAASVMRRQGGGRIVSVSSRGAFRGEPDMPAYGASKAGLNAFSQSMAKALAADKIFVYVVAPGFVDTERIGPRLEGARGDEIRAQSPMNRIARPEEVAQTVTYLALNAPEFMTGCIVDLNGASYLRQ